MPKCKLCGGHVTAADMMHDECLREKMNDAARKICDEYCKYADNLAGYDQEALEEQCINCPLVTLLAEVAYG